MQKSEYRSDIDGLRAIAVLAVLLCHLGVPGFAGGFVGVDVFFVISGYLISQIIYREVGAGVFSFVRFYERRARRILPAFVVVSALTALASYFILLPGEFESFSKSLAWSAAFMPNIYFHLTSGYFAPEAATLPLLHFWSLGVEEQFYVLFPVAILLCRRLSIKLITPAIIAVILASLAWTEYRNLISPGSTFYLPQYRAWELLIGSLIAVQTFPKARRRVTGAWLGAVGLALILAAIAFFSAEIQFPGIARIVPCVGAAMVICASNIGPSSRILSIAPVRYIGRISYSLYLVHWPILVFSGFLYPDLPALDRALSVALLSLAAASLSYHFVETPFRSGRLRLTRPALLGAAGIALASLITLALFGASGLLPSRVSDEVRRIEAFAKYPFAEVYREGQCFLRPEQTFADFDEAECLGPDRSVVLWGDSYAAHFLPGLTDLFGQELGQATASACPPVLGVTFADRPNCRSFNDEVLRRLVDIRPKAVILSANWARNDLQPAQMMQTVHRLEAVGIRVIVLGPTPYYSQGVPRLISSAILARSRDPGASSAGLSVLVMSAESKLRQLFPNDFISVLATLCPADRCPLFAAPDVPLQWDNGHLTKEASVLVIGKIASQISNSVEH